MSSDKTGTLLILGVAAYYFWQHPNALDSVLNPGTLPVGVPPAPYYPGSTVIPGPGGTVVSGGPESPGQAEQDVTQMVAVDLQTGKMLASGAGVAGASAAAVATGATTGTFIGLTAASWTIIGGVIAGAIALIYALRSDVHMYATELVNKYENPFGNYVIQLVAHMNTTWNAGTLVKLDAQGMTIAMQTAWNNYQSVMQQLMGKSTDWLIVTKQSLNNLDNRYQGERLPNGKVLGLGMGGAYPSGFMSQWLQWMNVVTNSL